MLDDLKGSFPSSLEPNIQVERVSETSVILWVKPSIVDTASEDATSTLNTSLQARNAIVRKWLASIEKQIPSWLSDYIISYDSLLLEFDPEQIEFGDLIEWLRKCNDEYENSVATMQIETQDKTHEIEVCYQFNDHSHPNDMSLVSQYTGLTTSDIIQLHQGTIYSVFAIGFMPNFAYLGELPQALSVPRLSEPRLKVPAGAVAITDNQTAVYPNESPGGWHIIGYTNFAFGESGHSAIGPNDKVVFKALDIDSYLASNKSISKSNV